MRRMKYKIGAFCLLAIGLWGCLEDKGVYDYDFDVAPLFYCIFLPMSAYNSV